MLPMAATAVSRGVAGVGGSRAGCAATLTGVAGLERVVTSSSSRAGMRRGRAGGGGNLSASLSCVHEKIAQRDRIDSEKLVR